MNELGEGGMSLVFRGQDLKLQRPVAIKFLHQSLSSDPKWLGRFKREARILTRVNHPHLLKIFSFEKDESGNVFIVTELIEGKSLSQVLREEGHLDWRRAVAIAIQVCQVMEFVHSQGIVHRDLKPGNILISSDPGSDFAKVIDFGLAAATFDKGKESQLTIAGQLIGTPCYMPPEGPRAGSRGDIYSLGCVLYEMISARKLFESETAMETLYKHASQEPLGLSQFSPQPVPLPVERIVNKSLNKDPKQRYQKMSEFQQALQSVVETPDLVPRAKIPISIRRAATVAACLLVLTGLCVCCRERVFCCVLSSPLVSSNTRMECACRLIEQSLMTGNTSSAHDYYTAFLQRNLAAPHPDALTAELKLSRALAAGGYSAAAASVAEDTIEQAVSMVKKKPTPEKIQNIYIETVCGSLDVLAQLRQVPSHNLQTELLVAISQLKGITSDQVIDFRMSMYRLTRQTRGDRDLETFKTMIDIIDALVSAGRTSEALSWIAKIRLYKDGLDRLILADCASYAGTARRARGEDMAALHEFRDLEQMYLKANEHELATGHPPLLPNDEGYLSCLISQCNLNIRLKNQEELHRLVALIHTTAWTDKVSRYHRIDLFQLSNDIQTSFPGEYLLIQPNISKVAALVNDRNYLWYLIGQCNFSLKSKDQQGLHRFLTQIDTTKWSADAESFHRFNLLQFTNDIPTTFVNEHLLLQSIISKVALLANDRHYMLYLISQCNLSLRTKDRQELLRLLARINTTQWNRDVRTFHRNNLLQLTNDIPTTFVNERLLLQSIISKTDSEKSKTDKESRVH